MTESKNDLPIFNPRHNSKDKAPEILSRSILKWKATHTGSFVRLNITAQFSILTNAIAWLSVQGTDFRSLFNERPIAIASFSGGGCMELLLSMRIQLTHLGALVLGRQLANKSKIAEDKSIKAILNQLLQLNHSN